MQEARIEAIANLLGGVGGTVLCLGSLYAGKRLIRWAQSVVTEENKLTTYGYHTSWPDEAIPGGIVCVLGVILGAAMSIIGFYNGIITLLNPSFFIYTHLH